MKTELVATPYTGGRTKITIVVNLTPGEREAQETTGALYLDTPTAQPVTVFATPNQGIELKQAVATWEGTPTRIFFLQSARKVLLPWNTPQKTHWRIPFPGTVEIGFVNEADLPTLKKWWQETVTNLREQAKERLFGVARKESQTPPPSSPETLVTTENNLNPFREDEPCGSRKRLLMES